MPLFWLAAPRDWRLVNEIVENFFGRVKISDSITKDECVATGACLALVKNYDPDEIIAYSLGQYVNGNEIQCVSRELRSYPLASPKPPTLRVTT